MTYAQYCIECEAVGFTPVSEHNWDLMTTGIAQRPARPRSLRIEKILDEREIERDRRENWK